MAYEGTPPSSTGRTTCVMHATQATTEPIPGIFCRTHLAMGSTVELVLLVLVPLHVTRRLVRLAFAVPLLVP